MGQGKGRPNNGNGTEADNDRTDQSGKDHLTEGQGHLSRRNLLKVGAAAAGVALGSQAITGSVAAETVDIVDAGADPTGEELIDGVLADVAGTDSTVVFPEGNYRIGSFSSSADNLELRGSNATLTPTSGGSLLNLSGRGAVVDGFEFDQRHLSSPINVTMGGPGDWVLENCVWRGNKGTSHHHAVVNPTVGDSSLTGTIRNCYFQDGGTGMTKAIWVGPSTSGTLRIERCWFQGWAENTIYASNVPGMVVVEQCFAHNSNVGIRIGGRSAVRDTVCVLDGPVPAQGWSGGSTMRGVWINKVKNHADSGQVTIDNCDFYWVDGRDAGTVIDSNDFGSTSNVSVDVTNSRIHNTTGVPCVVAEGVDFSLSGVEVSGDPQHFGGNSSLISGSLDEGSDPCATNEAPIPAPPELGSTPDGDSSSGGSTPSEPEEELPSLFRIVGVGEDTTTDYTLTVDGDLQHADVDGASIDGDDIIEGGTATGSVVNYGDAYRFSGEITALSLTGGPVRLYLNGQEVDPADLGADEETLPRTLTIDGTQSGWTGYEFTVTGSLAGNPDVGAIEDYDTIDGSTGSGFVDGDVDGYRFSGDISAFAIGGDATVFLDGQSVDPADLGEPADDPQLPNTILIDGRDADPTAYTFTVDGEVQKSPVYGSVDGDDVIHADGTVEGTIDDGVDGYVYSGDITSLDIDGNATISIEDTDG